MSRTVLEKIDMKDQILIEQLIAESELKTKWLSLIAHDFKGMFSSLCWLLESFENKTISQDIFLSMLPEIKQIADKNSKTLENTFNWVNLQSKGFNLQVEDISLHDLFLQLKGEMEERLTLKNIELKYIGAKEEQINTDKFLLLFILKQTIDNAIKYSNVGGEVKVRVESDSNLIHIFIEDDGMGMNDNVLDNMATLNVSPYTGSMNEKGAGLSMVIVNDFVEKLKGQMNIISLPKKGTVVKFKFSF